MPLFQAALLGIIQGATEFLPVSSSGHLSIARWLFGWDDPGLAFDAAVHAGALAAILVAYRREIIALLSGLRSARARPVDGVQPRRLLALGIAATLPIAAAGAIAWQLLEDQLRGPTPAAAFLLATGLILIAAERRLAPTRSGAGAPADADAHGAAGAEPSPGGLAGLSLAKAAAIGVAQAIAVLPGVSRSGMCISAAISLGANREAATRFAFWLAIPALAGAGLLALYDVVRDGASADPAALAIGATAAFLSALLGIRALLHIAKAATLAPFALYCLAAASAILLARAAGA